MEQAEQAKFSCSSCGKSYKWKPEFAGRKVKCKCGNVMTAPAAPPAADEPELDALYALADEGKQAAVAAPPSIRCPSCRSELEVCSTLCAQCGFDLKSGKRATASKPRGGGGVAPAGAGAGGAGVAVASSRGPVSPMLGYVPKRRGLEDEKGIEDNQVQDLYVPLGLIAFGLVAGVVQKMFFDTLTISAGAAVVEVLVGTVVEVIVLAVAFLVAIRMMDVALGSPGTGLLKLAAIAIAPAAVAETAGYLIGEKMFVPWVMQWAIWFGLFKYLFDLDLGEVLILSCIVFFARFVVGAFLVAAILGLFMAGGGDAIGSFANKKVTINDDAVVQDVLATRGTSEAREWMNDNSNRMFGDAGHAPGVALVDDLYAAGCKNIFVTPIKGDGQVWEMYAELPRDKAKRAAIFERYDKFATQYKIDKKEDQGQKYLLMDYSADLDDLEDEEGLDETDEDGAAEEEDDELGAARPWWLNAPKSLPQAA